MYHPQFHDPRPPSSPRLLNPRRTPPLSLRDGHQLPPGFSNGSNSQEARLPPEAPGPRRTSSAARALDALQEAHYEPLESRPQGEVQTSEGDLGGPQDTEEALNQGARLTFAGDTAPATPGASRSAHDYSYLLQKPNPLCVFEHSAAPDRRAQPGQAGGFDKFFRGPFRPLSKSPPLAPLRQPLPSPTASASVDRTSPREPTTPTPASAPRERTVRDEITTPVQSGTTPVQSGTTPVQSGTTPVRSGTMTSHTGTGTPTLTDTRRSASSTIPSVHDPAVENCDSGRPWSFGDMMDLLAKGQLCNPLAAPLGQQKAPFQQLWNMLGRRRPASSYEKKFKDMVKWKEDPDDPSTGVRSVAHVFDKNGKDMQGPHALLEHIINERDEMATKTDAEKVAKKKESDREKQLGDILRRSAMEKQYTRREIHDELEHPPNTNVENAPTQPPSLPSTPPPAAGPSHPLTLSNPSTPTKNKRKRDRSPSITSSPNNTPRRRKPKRNRLAESGYSGKGKRVAKPSGLSGASSSRHGDHDQYLLAIEEAQAASSRQTNMLIAEARRQTFVAEEISTNFGRLVHQVTRMTDAVAGSEDEEDEQGYESESV